MEKKPLTHAEVVMKGGMATKKKGKTYFKNLSKMGVAARKAKMTESKSAEVYCTKCEEYFSNKKAFDDHFATAHPESVV